MVPRRGSLMYAANGDFDQSGVLMERNCARIRIEDG